MKRKVLAGVLAGVLAVGVLTGCGSSKTEEKKRIYTYQRM